MRMQMILQLRLLLRGASELRQRLKLLSNSILIILRQEKCRELVRVRQFRLKQEWTSPRGHEWKRIRGRCCVSSDFLILIRQLQLQLEQLQLEQLQLVLELVLLLLQLQPQRRPQLQLQQYQQSVQ
jgi:hypothetical protein